MDNHPKLTSIGEFEKPMMAKAPIVVIAAANIAFPELCKVMEIALDGLLLFSIHSSLNRRMM